MSYPRGNLEGFYHRLRTPLKYMGRFTVDAVPAVVNVQGHGFTVARTAAGRYTVTFTHAVAQLYSARVTAHAAAANVDAYGQAGAFTPGAAGAATLVLRNMTGAVETELVVDDYLHFEVVVYGEALDP